jgi:hypothetical protein
VAENQHRIPEDNSSEWSREGNEAHTRAESLLLTGEAVFDSDFNNTAMERHCRAYAEFVNLKLKPGDTHLVEPEIPLWYMPERIGKIDSLIHGASRTYIVDLKYGEGVAVYARGNKQCAIYGRSVGEYLIGLGFEILDDHLFTIAIFQPRCSHGDKVSLWAITWAELKEFTQPIEDTAAAIQARKGLKFDATSKDACRWCDAQAFCPARIAYLGGNEMNLNLFDGLDEPGHTFKAPGTLSPRQVALILDRADEITAHIGHVRKYAADILASGKPDQVPGYKLVEANAGNRKWRDPELTASLLGDYLEPNVVWSDPKLISPAQAEKALSKEQLVELKPMWQELTYRLPGGKTLSRSTDSRESATVNPAAEFEDLTDGPDSLEGLDLL